MRLIRCDSHWQILHTDGKEALFLEGMAMECGYRLCELSQALGYSERYVNEVFGRDLGLPPKLWMRWERMVMARRMLGAGIPVWEVRDSLGFSQGNGFTKEFRKIYGIPPSKYIVKITEIS